jgi:hypothetical protein
MYGDKKHLSSSFMKGDAMPIPGETKQVYCNICETETNWEFIEVQLDDGVFGLQNAIQPEAHRVKFWRCCKHTTEDGRIKEEFKRLHKKHDPLLAHEHGPKPEPHR